MWSNKRVMLSIIINNTPANSNTASLPSAKNGHPLFSVASISLQMYTTKQILTLNRQNHDLHIDTKHNMLDYCSLVTLTDTDKRLMKMTECVCCVILVCEIDEVSTAIDYRHSVVNTFAHRKSNMPRASLNDQIVEAAVGGGGGVGGWRRQERGAN